MIYDVNNRILHIDDSCNVRLTEKLHQMLICLSSNEMITMEKLKKDLKCSDNALRVNKKRLVDATRGELKIKTMNGVGYRLENEIEKI